MNADTLVLLGTRFPYRACYPQEDASIIQIDIAPCSLGAYCKMDMALLEDIKSTLAVLLPQLREKTDRTFLNKALAHYCDTRRDTRGAGQAQQGESYLSAIRRARNQPAGGPGRRVCL